MNKIIKFFRHLFLGRKYRLKEQAQANADLKSGKLKPKKITVEHSAELAGWGFECLIESKEHWNSLTATEQYKERIQYAVIYVT